MKKRNLTALFLATSLCALTGLQDFAKSSKANYTKQITEEDKQYAQCLQEKGITMYGTSWCPHCKEQKHEFVELFSYVNYVDCDKNSASCREQKITGYPTWLLPNGKEIRAGSIKEVAQDSGCSLAKNNETSNETTPAKNTTTTTTTTTNTQSNTTTDDTLGDSQPE